MRRPETQTSDTEATVSGETPGTTEFRSKGHRIAFRIVISVVTLWILALNVFGLMELILMWLPEDTLSSMFGEEFSEIHRTHFVAIGIVAWAVVLSLVVQLRKPERRVAPMVFLAISVVAGTVLFGLSGTIGEWLLEEIAFVLIPIGLVAWLHPSRDEFLDKPVFDRPMVSLAGAATLPWLIYVVDNAGRQMTNAVGDTHADMEHWALAALLGVVISASAFLGASDHSGWRLSSWIAAGASVIFGIHSLVFPGLASALPAFWAVSAVGWGLGFGVLAVRRSRAVKAGQLAL